MNQTKLPESLQVRPRNLSKFSQLPNSIAAIRPSNDSLLNNISPKHMILSRRHMKPSDSGLNPKNLFLVEHASRSNSVMRNAEDSTPTSKKQIDISNYTQDELLETARDILSRPEGQRNAWEIRLMVKCTEKIKFFQNIGASTHEQCCKYMTYEKLDPQETLFEIGSYGTKFYIILKGSVSILANLFSLFEETSPGGTVHQRKEVRLSEVKILNAGESFGELALLENKPRAATIITLEETYFGVLEKQYYDQILKESELRKFHDEVEFYQSIDLFSSLASITLKYLVYHTEKKSYIRGQKVYKQHDSPDGFYIIRDGEFKMFCKIQTSQNSSVYVSSNLKEKKKTKKIDLSIMTKASFFGEEELIEECSRVSSVFCSSQTGNLVFISKREFLRRLYSEDKIRDYLLEYNQVKRNIRLTKLKAAKNIESSSFLSVLPVNKSELSVPQSMHSSIFHNNSTLTLNKKASLLIGKSLRRKSSILKLDFSKAFANPAIGQSNYGSFLMKNPVESVIKRQDSLMINSLNFLEKKSEKNSIFDHSIEGYNPVIGRTQSIFARNSEFSANSVKYTANSHSSFANLGLSLEKVNELTFKEKEEEENTEKKNTREITIFPREERNLSVYNGMDKINEGENDAFESPRLIKQRIFNKFAKSKSNLSNNVSFSELPAIKEIQRNLYFAGGKTKSHISSKSNILEEIKDSFKPREVLQLKAYHKYKEIKEKFNYSMEFKGKTQLEHLGKFELPKKIKIMINELHNKKQQSSIKAYSTPIDTSLTFPLENKAKSRQSPNKSRVETKTEEKIRNHQNKKVKSKNLDKKFLPLKYLASEIQAQTQNYLFFPRIQGNHKKNKGTSEGSGIFIEGKSSGHYSEY